MFTTQRGGPPGPWLPAGMSALMGVLGYGGTHGQEVCGVAAGVFDTDVHEGIEVNQFLTVEDGGSQQYVLTDAFLQIPI